MMQIQLQELLITVDSETGQQLLSDPDFASQYYHAIKKQFRSDAEGQKAPSLESREEPSNCKEQQPSSSGRNTRKPDNKDHIPTYLAVEKQKGDHEEHQPFLPGWNSKKSNDDYIPVSLQVDKWKSDCEEQPSVAVRNTKKPSNDDHMATCLLLEKRKEMASKFEDKKTTKNNLWTDIASYLNKKGYYVGEGIEGREKCRVKFSNLQAGYVHYIDKRKRTGEGQVKPCSYFEELEEILGKKHKINPPLILDSIEIAERPSSSCTPSKVSICEEKENTNRFKEVKKSVKPKSDRHVILEKLFSSQEENREQRRLEFETMTKMIQEQNRLRHEQIMALIKSSNNKKRKRKNSSDDSE